MLVDGITAMTLYIQTTLVKALSRSSVVYSQPQTWSKLIVFNRRFASSERAKKDEEHSTEKTKPNLRQVQNKNKSVVIVACLLAVCYMYPMIFKPLFFGDSMGKFT